MKMMIGLILAIFVGIGCRLFSIPLPGPPAILGALMAVAMASGYTLTDYMLQSRSIKPTELRLPTTERESAFVVAIKSTR